MSGLDKAPPELGGTALPRIIFNPSKHIPDAVVFVVVPTIRYSLFE